MIPMIKKTTKQGVEQYDLFSYEFQQRVIRITGEINDQEADEFMVKLAYLDALNHDPIKIIINSPGGSVSSGLAMLDAMNAAESEIETVCTGVAASMGAFLVACGGRKGKRSITKNAEMMIHQPMGGISGQAADVRLTAIHLVKVKKKLVLMLAKATGKSAKKIGDDMDRDYWLNAEEAVKYGLVDFISYSGKIGSTGKE